MPQCSESRSPKPQALDPMPYLIVSQAISRVMGQYDNCHNAEEILHNVDETSICPLFSPWGVVSTKKLSDTTHAAPELHHIPAVHTIPLVNSTTLLPCQHSQSTLYTVISNHSATGSEPHTVTTLPQPVDDAATQSLMLHKYINRWPQPRSGGRKKSPSSSITHLKVDTWRTRNVIAWTVSADTETLIWQKPRGLTRYCNRYAWPRRTQTRLALPSSDIRYDQHTHSASLGESTPIPEFALRHIVGSLTISQPEVQTSTERGHPEQSAPSNISRNIPLNMSQNKDIYINSHIQ